MSRYHSYLNTARSILQQYNGATPFASFLKKYFSTDKKYGSKDRKQIGHLCYCFFRMGKMRVEMPVEERLIAGLFLCSNEHNDMLENLRPDLNAQVSKSLPEKCSILNIQFGIFRVFPWLDQLSEGIDEKKFCESLFVQPDLFLRLRPGFENKVEVKLREAGVGFSMPTVTCMQLPNATNIESLIELNKEAVVQDYSSQRVAELFETLDRQPIKVWDCCAASGGKSIMLYDFFSRIELMVTDVRESILVNLKRRFKAAGISNYKSLVADLSAPGFEFPYSNFDLIVADVPCTGSGTWSRTPEQLYYFDERKIDQYHDKQKKIITQVIPNLQPGGYILYITCSVFKKENEDIVAMIVDQTGWKLARKEVLKGYDKKADTMFAALIHKSE